MAISRRNAIRVGLASLVGAAHGGCGDTVVDPAPGPVITAPSSLTAQVSTARLSQVIQQQQCPQWCWAACISMMFDFYGHPLSQAPIVAATYGNVVCLPASTTTTIGSAFTRGYIDERGIPFFSRVVAAYDVMNGINAINNQMIVDALNSNNPLLYCNTHHAMVVYSVTYMPTAFGPNVQRVDVVDPWPFSPRTHALTTAEMNAAHIGGEMTFLAQIQVT